jgi:hypothetical protein
VNPPKKTTTAAREVAAQIIEKEDWPDAAWRDWRYRRASIARLLDRDGMMEPVAWEYDAVCRRYAQPPSVWQRLKSILAIN